MPKITLEEARKLLAKFVETHMLQSPPAPGKATSTTGPGAADFERAMAVVALETLDIVEQMRQDLQKRT